MKIRGDGVTVDLVVMGYESGGRDEPVREAEIPLTDGKWATQYRGESAPRRNFRGAFVPNTEIGDAAAAEWAKMSGLKGKELEIVEVTDGAETVVGKGCFVGALRIEDPDVLQGKPVWRRWRFSVLETAS